LLLASTMPMVTPTAAIPIMIIIAFFIALILMV
jgi:hypothetical protein